MSHSFHHINVDCRDPYALSRFWLHVTGFSPELEVAADDEEVLLFDPLHRMPNLLFTRVPESKTIKNRFHLDLQPLDTTRDLSVADLLTHGATMLDDRRRSDGSGWVVLADPEGNEFCIERSTAEKGRDPWRHEPHSLGERPMPSVRTADEFTMLTEMLDWYRAGVVHKCSGLTDQQASRRLLESESTIIGIVNHLALVEDSWFEEAFAGRAPIEHFAGIDWEADPDFEFRTARDESLATVLGRYETACDRSRQTALSCTLDQLGVSETRAPFTLRYVLVHMIEETARHLGHIDILRELTDSASGD